MLRRLYWSGLESGRCRARKRRFGEVGVDVLIEMVFGEPFWLFDLGERCYVTVKIQIGNGNVNAKVEVKRSGKADLTRTSVEIEAHTSLKTTCT